MKFVIVTIAVLLTDFCALKLWLPSPADFLEGYYNANITAVGYIEPLSVKENPNSVSFILNCEGLNQAGKEIEYTHKLRISVPLSEYNKENDYKSKQEKPIGKFTRAGKIVVEGKLLELCSFANPGGFNMDSYNRAQDLGGMLLGKHFQLIDNTPRWLDYFALINLRLREKVFRNVKGDSAGVLVGMVLGGGNGLSEEIRESFAANGLSHLLSVSGAHLLLLSAFLNVVFKGINETRRKFLILIIMSGYACICGLKPPVLRALGMSAVLLWGNGREASKGNILCFLCLVFVIFQPVVILDLGFQLSFGAAAGLIWLLHPLKNKLGAILSGELQEGVAVTLASQLATLPILVNCFHTIPLVSIFSNIILVPVLELATILTIVGMLLSGCIEPFSGIAFQLAGWLVEQVLVLASLLKNFPFSRIVVGELPLFCCVLYYALLFSYLDLGAFLLLSQNQRQLLIGTCSTILLFSYGWQQWKPTPLTVYFLDVGQGDAAVVFTPAHEVVLIDSGGLKGVDTGSRIVVPFLHSLGKDCVDYFIPSHGDYDHIGGAVGIARNMPIKHIILPKESLSDEGRTLVQNILNNSSKAEVEIASAGKHFILQGIQVSIASTSNKVVSGNDASTVLEVKDTNYGYKFLFTGDISYKREKEMEHLSNYTVLKVGHHGSNTSSSEAFLARINPKLAVISCGVRNKYGHPHKATVNRLKQLGCTIKRTDLDGCIKLETGPEGISIYEYRIKNKLL